MPRSIRIAGLSLVAWLVAITLTWAQAPVDYRLSFADYVRHVVDVEVVFSDVTADPLDIHMSRSSPGRYALHEFAKNVFDVQITDGAGRPLTPARPNLHVWRVKDHGGTVRVRYRLFADRIDGTYAGVDATQAHLNLPATLMWAKTLETRPATADVRAASRRRPGRSPRSSTPPTTRWCSRRRTSPTCSTARCSSGRRCCGRSRSAVSAAAPQTTPQATIRVALRHDGTEAEADRFAGGVEKIVREARAVFGELPAFEPGHYTFLATYAQGASGDGMEHRNSTVLTAPAALAQAERPLLGTVAHEFFHAWNVERIRPRSLEPFNFDDANVSSELWVAEGFTQYYGPLLMARAGLSTREDALRSMGGLINAVNASAGRRVRFAPEMSRLAPFVDAACSVDPTNWGNTYLSYYTFGAAIALGLDLELRDRTDGKVTLDDYMKALWTKYGKTPSAPGHGRHAVHGGRPPDHARRGERQRLVRARVLRALRRRPGAGRVRHAAEADGADLEAALSRARLDGRPADDQRHRRRPHHGRRADGHARLRRRLRRGRRAGLDRRQGRALGVGRRRRSSRPPSRAIVSRRRSCATASRARRRSRCAAIRRGRW